MKVEIGVIMISCLAIGIGSCEKNDPSDSKNEAVISDYALVADSLRNDSTIENNEILALACEELFDRKRIGEKSTASITKEFMTDQISLHPFNGNTLVQIHYEYWGEFQQHMIGMFLVDSSLAVLSKGLIKGAWYRSPEISLEDWNNDDKIDLVVKQELPIRPPDIVEQNEKVYAFDKKSGLKSLFEIVTEYRNCSSSMEMNYNYTARSYKFISKDKLEVKESNYFIDCEEFERMGKISKLRKVSTKSYPIEL